MMTPFVKLLIVQTILISISLCSGQCIPRESKALLMFKRSLIDHSDMLASWDAEEDCCSWFGIICDNFTGHVQELHLQGTIEGNIISESLLELKQLEYLDLSNNYIGGISIPDFFGFMSSLRFLNLSRAVFGGTIPSSIGNLTSLETLDLSFNDFEGEIPPALGNLSNLQYLSIGSALYNIDKLDWVSGLLYVKVLDFSGVNMGAASDWVERLGKLPSLQQLHISLCQLTHIPPISNVSFSSLSVLDLSANNFYGIADTMAALRNLTSLRKLDLSNCFFNSLFITNTNLFSDFTRLELLDLSGNGLEGQIPSSIGNLTYLNTLDLSINNFVGPIPSFIGNLTSLNTLDLSVNNFVGQIPSSVGDLTSLDTLDLSYNNFVGRIPTTFKSLCNLRSLSLSWTQLSQPVNELIQILSTCASEKLESLDLFSCQFSGYLSNHLVNFTSLASLDISNNSIAGPLPVGFGEMASLRFLDLSSNKLNGSLPLSFGRLENLANFDVSYNSLKGEVSEIHFKNLHNLLRFDANENHLIWKVNPDWIPPFPKVEILHLRSCEVGPQFPNWLRHLKYLKELDMSYSNINSPLPTWVFNFYSSLNKFDLSYNYIDLSSNHLEGLLPYVDNPPSSIDLSNNMLSGSVHNFFCNRNSLVLIRTTIIVLKENHLNGEIPDGCLMNWKNLEVLDLSNNNFTGNIPRSIGRLKNLQLLSLRDNSFSGEIPPALQNCTMLVILDLGENELSGGMPSWIAEHLREMKVLSTRGNKFRGHLSKDFCNLTKLQILDFANNYLNGTVPKCVGNLMGMSNITYPKSGRILIVASKIYRGSSTISRKGQMVEYKTTLAFVQSLDLSNNSFVGEIPPGITNLSRLQSLNLSYNFLTGRIPPDINALQKLESLDLSQNRLFGEIPQSMSSMNFLSNLNLSNNNLSGKIPTSTQLQSMDPSSFGGNELCGPPLTKDCSNKEATPPSNAERREDHGSETGAVDWFYFYVSLVPGFVVGFWCVVGPLAFNIRWRRAYYNFLDLLWDKICVWFHVYIVKFARNYGS